MIFTTTDFRYITMLESRGMMYGIVIFAFFNELQSTYSEKHCPYDRGYLFLNWGVFT